MDVLQDILLIVLLIGGIVLTFVSISMLRSSQKTLETIGKDIQRLGNEAASVFSHVERVAEQASEALTIISENRVKISAAAENIRKVTENIYRLENLLQEQLEPGVAGLARRIAGVRRGIDAFFESWRRR
jgi:peptidoglycan hydrolase CwlO-like protein